MIGIITGILEQGLIFGIMALGVYITVKILDFPDLSVDGTFPLGGAVAASLILHGINPWIAMICAFICGALAGTLTGFLNVKLKIPDLLSGILTMTALYSVNYRIAGAPNVFLMGEKTIFNTVPFTFPAALVNYSSLIIVAFIAVIVKICLDMYLKTKSGFLLRSVGDNPGLVITLAQNPGKIKIIGLAIANGLVCMAGCINSMKNVQFDISGGTGTLVMGLAAVIIGTSLFSKLGFVKVTTAVFGGMIIYKACIVAAISSGLQSSDMNLVITVLFVITLIINRYAEGKRKD